MKHSGCKGPTKEEAARLFEAEERGEIDKEKYYNTSDYLDDLLEKHNMNLVGFMKIIQTYFTAPYISYITQIEWNSKTIS